MTVLLRTSITLRRIGFGVAIFLSTFLALAGSSHAHAATSYSITMTPSSTEIHAAPGGTAQSSFTVVNQGSTDYPIQLSVAPYYVVGDSYDPQFTLLPGKTDASTWVHFTDSGTQTLRANKVQTIDYTLAVPAGTAPGGYYAVIFAETNPPASSAGVTAHNRVGNILYITVDGAVTQKGTLSVPSPDVPSVIWGNSADLGVLVGDTGGLHFLSTSTISVTNLLGNTLFTAHLQRYVLPQTQRLVTTTWDNLPLVGLYKLTRNATVAGTVQNLPARYILIIRPWLLAFVLAVIAAIVTAGVMIRRRTSTNKVTSSKEKPHVRN